MLIDESINLAVCMIHVQFPQIGVLIDSSQGKYQQFGIVQHIHLVRKMN